MKIVHCTSTKQHGGIKSGVSHIRNPKTQPSRK